MRKFWLLVWGIAGLVLVASMPKATTSLVGQEGGGAAQAKPAEGKGGKPGRKLGAKLRPKQQAKPAVLKPDSVTTAVIPKGLVTLRVRFSGKPAAGAAKAEPAAESSASPSAEKLAGKPAGKRAGKPGAKPQPTVWDGELSVSQGTLRSIQLWQDDPRDWVEGQKWKLSTKHSTPWSTEERKKGHAALPVIDAALVIELLDTNPDTELKFQTAQGDFSVQLKEIPLGTAKSALNNLAQVSRMANSTIMLSAPTDDDYPTAIVGRDGKLYVAYQAFTHGKDFRRHDNLQEEPKSLDNLDEPTGGDQVLLLRLDGDKWTGPLPVTPPGQDVYRTAIAADGSGRVWVFWSAKAGDLWNIYARNLQGEQWSAPLRLTDGPGPDILPVATTDSAGRVWLAWQGFRNGSYDILAMRQEGDKFGRPIVVADGPANDWSPAIAASADGQVAVAWDTYSKGDYDVYCRVWASDHFGSAIPVATSLEGQMRPSAVFDRQDRLWIAYETAPEHWGKDWGALEKTGVPLYQGRSVEVRVWAEGKLWQPAEDAAAAFNFWRPHVPQQAAARRKQLQLAAPRLACDSDGQIWLTCRSGQLGGRAPVGPVWYEHALRYDGDRWSGQIVCPHTDNILDNMPALVARPNGGIWLIGSTDLRGATTGNLPGWFMQELRRDGQEVHPRGPQPQWPDPINNELVLGELTAAGAPPAKIALQPVEAAMNGTPPVEAQAETAAIARCRAARTSAGGQELRLVRGEFHRHTEISPDGGGDGMLLDMWRYALDAAGLDWVGNGDHDNGNGREYSWWIIQKTTDMFTVPARFTPMYTYERSVNYPDGHRNVVFARRGIRTLPRLAGGLGQALDDMPADAPRPHSPDTQLLYRYLEQFDGVCASHTSGTDMGTDWRDTNAKVEPIVEIYQGCRQNYEMPGAPRANTADDSIGGWRPYGFVSLALQRGTRLGFQASSDHVSTHISFCCCWAAAHDRPSILAAMKARHVYGATDDIVADVRCGDHFMGDEFEVHQKPALSIHLIGTGPFAKVHVIKDGKYVHTVEPNRQDVQLQWTDFDPQPGKTSYYYVRGEQANGQLVWVSPMWIRYRE